MSRNGKGKKKKETFGELKKNKPWNKMSILFQNPGVNNISDAPTESQIQPAKQTQIQINTGTVN